MRVIECRMLYIFCAKINRLSSVHARNVTYMWTDSLYFFNFKKALNQKKIALAKVTNWYKVHALVLPSFLAPVTLPPAYHSISSLLS